MVKFFEKAGIKRRRTFAVYAEWEKRHVGGFAKGRDTAACLMSRLF